MKNIFNIISKHKTSPERVLGIVDEPDQDIFEKLTRQTSSTSSDIEDSIKECINMIPDIDIDLDMDEEDIKYELDTLESTLSELDDCLDNVRYTVSDIDVEFDLDEKFSEAIEWGEHWKNVAMELLIEKGMDIEEYLDKPYSQKIRRYNITKFFLDKKANV